MLHRKSKNTRHDAGNIQCLYLNHNYSGTGNMTDKNFTSQGVKLRLIQALMRLNFSLWRPNPEN